jgi:hypothetical protein
VFLNRLTFIGNVGAIQSSATEYIYLSAEHWPNLQISEIFGKARTNTLAYSANALVTRKSYPTLTPDDGKKIG